MDVKFWVENYGTISLLIGIILGLVTKGRRLIIYAVRSINLGHRFHNTFGDTPAETIKDLYDSIQCSYDTMEVRQRIAEKFIKLGIYICSPEGKCIWSNECLNEIFGLDSEDMKGNGWLKAVAEKDRVRVNEHWIYCVRNKISYECDYCIHNHRNDTYTNVTTNAIAVLDDRDEIQCYVGYLTVKGNKIENNSGH